MLCQSALPCHRCGHSFHKRLQFTNPSFWNLFSLHATMSWHFQFDVQKDNYFPKRVAAPKFEGVVWSVSNNDDAIGGVHQLACSNRFKFDLRILCVCVLPMQIERNRVLLRQISYCGRITPWINFVSLFVFELTCVDFPEDGTGFDRFGSDDHNQLWSDTKMGLRLTSAF